MSRASANDVVTLFKVVEEMKDILIHQQKLNEMQGVRINKLEEYVETLQKLCVVALPPLAPGGLPSELQAQLDAIKAQIKPK